MRERKGILGGGDGSGDGEMWTLGIWVEAWKGIFGCRKNWMVG